jgi:hypothetical protein
MQQGFLNLSVAKPMNSTAQQHVQQNKVCIRLLYSDHMHAITCMDKLTQSNFFLLTKMVEFQQLTLADKSI